MAFPKRQSKLRLTMKFLRLSGRVVRRLFWETATDETMARDRRKAPETATVELQRAVSYTTLPMTCSTKHPNLLVLFQMSAVLAQVSAVLVQVSVVP